LENTYSSNRIIYISQVENKKGLRIPQGVCFFIFPDFRNRKNKKCFFCGEIASNVSKVEKAIIWCGITEIRTVHILPIIQDPHLMIELRDVEHMSPIC